MIYDRVLAELKENKALRESGKEIAIPWLNLPKLSSVIPGIQKGRYYLISANSKVGKTQIADYLFLYEPLNYIFNTPNTQLKLKIFYFSLEMSKEDKILQMISNKIYKDKGIIISTDNLRSYFNGYILPNQAVQYIESCREYFEWVETVVTFIDKTRNPFGIYNTVRQYAKDNGKFYRNDGTLVTMIGTDTLYDYYIPNDPNEQVIVITDHVSLLTPEKDDDLHKTMSTFSTDYCLKMRDNFKYTVVNVQQQAASSERQQFSMVSNKLAIDKLRPTAEELGDNKLTSRDVDIMIGLFAPHRYKIKTYAGYDISKLKDNYRELSIILNRRGPSTSLDLYFEGASNYFRELGKDEFRAEQSPGFNINEE